MNDTRLIIKKNEMNGGIESAACTMDSGFFYKYVAMGNAGSIVVTDKRGANDTAPVAFIVDLPTFYEIAEIESLVRKIIHLYTAYQVISIAHNIDEFEETFRKIA